MGCFVKNQKKVRHCKSLYINYFITFSFLCFMRFDPGSGHKEKELSICKSNI